MTASAKEMAAQSDDSMRIWYQSFVDPQQQQSYIDARFLITTGAIREFEVIL